MDVIMRFPSKNYIMAAKVKPEWLWTEPKITANKQSQKLVHLHETSLTNSASYLGIPVIT
jgi:hypothetical protein